MYSLARSTVGCLLHVCAVALQLAHQHDRVKLCHLIVHNTYEPVGIRTYKFSRSASAV